MASNLINKYVWLVETLQRTGKISLEDISRKWQANVALSGGNPLPERTFHKWRIAVEDMFDLCICCDRTDGYRYYIDGDSQLAHKGLRNWLFNSFATTNLLAECKNLSERIMVEDIPSGQLHLQPIIEAIKNNHQIEIVHRSFGATEDHISIVCPYALRLHRQRWYLLAKKGDEMRTYGLDRIRQLKELPQAFVYPSDFSPEVYYEGCIGVMAGKDVAMENVVLKVDALQANYLRTLKLHSSQTEVERNERFSIFSLRVRPTFDFVQQLLMQVDALEVVSPQWLRIDMENKARKILARYSSHQCGK